MSELVEELLARSAALHDTQDVELLGSVVRLREVLAEHERREAQLRALYDAARDLTEIRDAEHILSAVTKRTQRLLGCELAYLSARTDESEEYFAVRAWSGQASPAFQGTKVRLDQGVGGRVVRTRRPFQVQDYTSAPEIAHTEYLDRQVAAEGIAALLGVPLEVNGRLLGILFAARRSTGEFTPDQVDLAASLAAHAAVALDNAELFGKQREALEKLERSSALLRQHTAAVETAAGIHAQLTEALVQGADVGTIAEVIANSLASAITVLGPENTPLAVRGPQALRVPVPPLVLESLAQSRASGRAVRTRHGGLLWHASAAVGANRILGSVIAATPEDLSDVDVRTLERATQTIAVRLLSEAAAIEADRRAAGAILERLLNQTGAEPKEIERTATRHGLTGPYFSVVVCDTASEHRDAQIQEALSLCRQHGGLAGSHQDRLVLALPLPAEEAAQTVWGSLSHAKATTACSGDLGTALDLPTHYRQALSCLELMEPLGRRGQWAVAAEFGLYSLLLTPDAAAGLEILVNRTIGPVLQYDQRHQTTLADTALAYLDAASSSAKASSALGVHVNTISQRLSRIDRLLGPGWRNGSTQLDVHNALRINSLRAARGAGARQEAPDRSSSATSS